MFVFVSSKKVLQKYLFTYFTAREEYCQALFHTIILLYCEFSSKIRFKKIKVVFTLLFATMSTMNNCVFFNFNNFTVKSWYFSGISDSSPKTIHQLIEVLTHFLVTMVVKQTIGTIHYILTVFGVWIYIEILQTLQRFDSFLFQFFYFVYLMIGMIKPIMPNDLRGMKLKVN